jgi:hypothetical protein
MNPLWRAAPGRPSAFVLASAVALAAAAALVFSAAGSSTSRTAQAGPPASTPTPRPDGLGPLSGLFDVEVGPGFYRCIARTDEDSVTFEAETTLQCYVESETGPTVSEPPCSASHSTGATPIAVVPGEGTCLGHKIPPPYSPQQPTILRGFYCPPPGPCSDPRFPAPWSPVAGDTLITAGCFADTGGPLGPNAIVVSKLPDAVAANPPIDGDPGIGTVTLFLGATNAECASAADGIAPGGAGTSFNFELFRRATSRDYDGDGCTDMQELLDSKTGTTTTTCGDDPWNPFDPTGPNPDVSGPYDVLLTHTRADAGAPGTYLLCNADLQQSGTNLTARTLCYFDSASITVNPQAAGGAMTCPPAGPKFCGDGLPGASPPGCSLPAESCAARANQGTGCPSLPCDVSQYQFADIDNAHAVLTGALDNDEHSFYLEGCFVSDPPEGDGFGQMGNMYLTLEVYASTGDWFKRDVWVPGTPKLREKLYPNQTRADCVAGTPSGTPIDLYNVLMVRQAPGAKSAGCSSASYFACRDSDGDGCPDKRELRDTAGGTGTGGGLRDPWNRFDYFNPEKANTPHTQTVSDILKVVNQFGKNQGHALYTIDTDRTAVIGGNVWNLGPPDGMQTVADILAAVKQYSQNC